MMPGEPGFCPMCGKAELQYKSWHASVDNQLDRHGKATIRYECKHCDFAGHEHWVMRFETHKPSGGKG